MIERFRITEHVSHTSNPRHVPLRNVLVEENADSEQACHVGNEGHIPTFNGSIFGAIFICLISQETLPDSIFELRQGRKCTCGEGGEGSGVEYLRGLRGEHRHEGLGGSS